MNLRSGPFYDRHTTPPPEGLTINSYKLIALLSDTSCSTVYKALKIESNDYKVLKFVKLIRKNIDRIENEISIMQSASHPNILKLEDTFRYGAYVCLVTDYAPHQDLQKYIKANYPNGVPEITAVKIFKQMLDAVSYLHTKKVCHRDIKLENFLVFDSKDSLRIVLADLGFSIQFSEDIEKCDEFCGTLEYMAPEFYMFNPYDQKVDIWSLGISLFEILTAKLPFTSKKNSAKELGKKILNQKLDLELLKELKISDEAVDLLTKLCTKSPNKRISAEMTAKHSWLEYRNEISYELKKCESPAFNNLII